jgi:hypothetical protein
MSASARRWRSAATRESVWSATDTASDPASAYQAQASAAVVETVGATAAVVAVAAISRSRAAADCTWRAAAVAGLVHGGPSGVHRRTPRTGTVAGAAGATTGRSCARPLWRAGGGTGGRPRGRGRVRRGCCRGGAEGGGGGDPAPSLMQLRPIIPLMFDGALVPGW